MLESINNKVEIILQRLVEKNKTMAMALNNSVDLLKEVCLFIEKYNRLIKNLSSESKPTLHLVLIYYFLIKDEICKIK